MHTPHRRAYGLEGAGAAVVVGNVIRALTWHILHVLVDVHAADGVGADARGAAWVLQAHCARRPLSEAERHRRAAVVRGVLRAHPAAWHTTTRRVRVRVRVKVHSMAAHSMVDRAGYLLLAKPERVVPRHVPGLPATWCVGGGRRSCSVLGGCTTAARALAAATRDSCGGSGGSGHRRRLLGRRRLWPWSAPASSWSPRLWPSLAPLVCARASPSPPRTACSHPAYVLEDPGFARGFSHAPSTRRSVVSRSTPPPILPQLQRELALTAVAVNLPRLPPVWTRHSVTNSRLEFPARSRPGERDRQPPPTTRHVDAVLRGAANEDQCTPLRHVLLEVHNGGFLQRGKRRRARFGDSRSGPGCDGGARRCEHHRGLHFSACSMAHSSQYGGETLTRTQQSTRAGQRVVPVSCPSRSAA